jgi:glutamate dehydrogenase (NAD(P)+)
MGGPAARLLAQLGAVVVGWADDQKCLGAAEGLDVEELYARRTRGRLPWAAAWREPASILQVECDVLLLAAVSRAISPAEVGRMRCRGVVEAANLAIAPEVEQALVEAGIVVVPDFVASVGGSLSVEALYATRPTSGAGIVSHVMRRATGLASDLLTAGQHSETSLREIGEAQAADFLQQTARLSPSA